MIILGALLLLFGLIFHIYILWIIGIILLIIGLVALLVPIGGSRHRWY